MLTQFLNNCPTKTDLLVLADYLADHPTENLNPITLRTFAQNPTINNLKPLLTKNCSMPKYYGDYLYAVFYEPKQTNFYIKQFDKSDWKKISLHPTNNNTLTFILSKLMPHFIL